MDVLAHLLLSLLSQFGYWMLGALESSLAILAITVLMGWVGLDRQFSWTVSCLADWAIHPANLLSRMVICPRCNGTGYGNSQILGAFGTCDLCRKEPHVGRLRMGHLADVWDLRHWMQKV